MPDVGGGCGTDTGRPVLGTLILSLSPDALVLGAGPAGCLTAAFLAERGLDVCVLERERFPRFALGESLLPRCTDHLLSAGLLSGLASRGYQRKEGVVFLRGEQRVALDFEDQHTLGWPYTWQVPRADFDQTLANALAQRGVPVWFGHTVTGFVPGAHPAVTLTTSGGRTRRVLPRLVVDATGHARLLAGLLGLEVPSQQPHRRALYAHVRRSRAGRRIPDGRTVFAQHPDGAWIWLIPLSDELSSVGVVAPPAFFETRAGDPTRCLAQVFDDVPALGKRLHWKRLVREPDIADGFSADVSRLHGPGYVLVGGALGFVDPMFSTGVTVAMESAARAAPLIVQALNDETVDWEDDYAAPLMQGINVVKTFVNGWYDGTLADVFFAPTWHPIFRRQLTSILSGHLWDDTNPFVSHAERRALEPVQSLEPPTGDDGPMG